MSKKSIWFIINPKAGSKKGLSIQSLIDDLIDKKNYAHQCIFTEYAGHGSELAKDAVKQKITTVVAVGGDGTINEIAKELIDSQTALAIIPTGSGNGLARELGISLNPKKAILQALKGSKKQIDTCFINKIPFFCSAGMGFDAHCAKKFAENSGNRGFLNYVKIALSQYFTFEPLNINFAGIDYQAFSLSFGNARQFGNNAFITPNAEINDGYFDIMLIKKHPFFMGGWLTWQLFAKNIDTSNFSEQYRSNKIVVTAKQNILIHFDGEPKQLNTNKIEVSIKEKCLNLIC